MNRNLIHDRVLSDGEIRKRQYNFCTVFLSWLPRQEGRRQAPLVTFVTANLRHQQVAIINCSPLCLHSVHRTVCGARRAVYSLVIALQTHLLTMCLMLQSYLRSKVKSNAKRYCFLLGYTVRNSYTAPTTLSNSFLLRKLFSFALKN